MLPNNPQRSVRTPGNRAIGRPGERVDLTLNDADEALEPSGGTFDGFTITCSDVNTTELVVRLEKADDSDIYLEVTLTPAGASAALRGDDLADQLSADYNFTAWVDNISSNGAGVVSFTSKLPFDLTLSVTDTGGAPDFVAANPTAFDEGDETRFGYPVYKQTDGKYSGAERTLSGDTHALTPTLLNNTDYTVEIVEADGSTTPATYTSDASATAKEIVEGLKAAIDALSITGVTTSEDDATLTVVFADPGATILFNAAQLTDSVTDGVAIEDVLAGVAVRTRTRNTEVFNGASSSGVERFTPDELIIARRKGCIIVDTPNTVSRGDQVFVGTGANKGKFYNVDGANREALALSAARWKRQNVIEVTLPLV